MAYRNNPVADVITLSTGAGSTFSLPLPPAAAAPAAVPPAAAPAAAPAPPTATAPAGRLPATGALDVLPVLGGLLLLGALAARRRAPGTHDA